MLKRIKSTLLILLMSALFFPLNIFAYSDYIQIGGENIGLKINVDGVIVSGFYQVNDEFIQKESSLEKGDIITKVENKKVNNIEDFVKEIENKAQEYINITYKRDNNNYQTKLKLVKENKITKTGLYVKDVISGLGTLTYIDPNTKIYGALGHEVIDTDSNIMVEVLEGKIYNSKVTDIDKSVRGEPGSKNAKVDMNDSIGTIKENTKSGIFGTYESIINKDNLYKVADFNEIKIGNAKIITVINDNEKKEYNINILKLDDKTNRNILFEVLDEKLINKTGGIVQGMSGSPIIQDNKIIGAVTNVVVNNPKKGYGIFIKNMLKEGEN